MNGMKRDASTMNSTQPRPPNPDHSARALLASEGAAIVLGGLAIAALATGRVIRSEVTLRASAPPLLRFAGKWPPANPTSPGTDVPDYVHPLGIRFVRVPAPPPLPGAPPCPPEVPTAPCHFLFVSESEVTQQQWFAVTGFNSSDPQRADLPVNNVHFMEVRAYNVGVGWIDGGTYRLPSAYEWEWLVRAGLPATGPIEYPWCPSPHRAQTDGTDAELPPTSGRHPWGLRSLCDSVAEWTAVDEDPESLRQALSTQSAPVRGWFGPHDASPFGAPGAIDRADFFHKSSDLGFRLVLEPRQ
jgi:hypothetical protein